MGDVFPSWTPEEIERAELGDLQKMAEFGTEFTQGLNIHRYDEAFDGCFLRALGTYIDRVESGKCTQEGAVIFMLREIVHGHSAFAAYVPGPLIHPRPSEVIRAELQMRANYDEVMKDELEEALSEEAANSITTTFGKTRDGTLESDGSIDDIVNRSAEANPLEPTSKT
jgi:hypothetical protein